MNEKRVVDWESIERDYRAGLLSVREIAAAQGVSHTAIQKRAKVEGWDRDLKAKILAKAEAKLARSMAASVVTPEQAAKAKANDAQLVEVNATAVANLRMSHRVEIQRCRALVSRLVDELAAQTDDQGEFQRLGEIIASEADRGGAKLAELYERVISLPQRIKGMKELGDTLKTMISLEREAWGLASALDIAPKPAEIDPMEGARRLAFILAQANTQLQRAPNG